MPRSTTPAAASPEPGAIFSLGERRAGADLAVHVFRGLFSSATRQAAGSSAITTITRMSFFNRDDALLIAERVRLCGMRHVRWEIVELDQLQARPGAGGCSGMGPRLGALADLRHGGLQKSFSIRAGTGLPTHFV